jgi:glycosyltransferase involved in cell wall biosynthesis
MRILLALDDLRIGGGQKVAVNVAEQMVRLGHEVAVVSLNTFPGATVEADFQRLGVPIRYFPARRLLSVGRFRRLVQLLLRERYDILHTHLTYANILGCAAGRFAGTPVLATVHSTGKDPLHRNIVREWLETIALRYLANNVFAVGAAVEQAYKKQLGNRRIVTIPNAVAEPVALSAEERATIRKEWMADPDGMLIFSAGRLAEPKGYDHLIIAMSLLRERFPSARLLIAGDGDLRSALQAQIDSLQLRGHVTLLGARKDVPRLMRAADIYVCSSRWEGLPLSLLEAMICGLPVVATNVGDIASAVPLGAGKIVPAREPTPLAEAIGEFLADPALRASNGSAAREYALRHFAIQRWADRLAALYRAMRNRASAARNS